MEPYKVLLVDDEEEVCQAMIKKLDWEAMGFSVVGYAGNGEEALEMAEKLIPDVVMTDIKMPYMDGLTLCRKLKERFGGIKVIIFSGFDEFEYAKEAVKLEAEEYILKPINSIELREVFTKVKKTIDKELDEKQNVEKLRAYYNNSLPIMQEHFLISLLEGRIRENQIKAYLTDYQMDDWSRYPYFAVSVIHPELMAETVTKQQEVTDSLALYTLSLRHMVEESLQAYFGFRSLNYLGNIIVILNFERTKQLKTYSRIMERTGNMAKRILHLDITVGVGQMCSTLTQLSQSYEGAKEALLYKVIYSDNPVINIAEIEPSASHTVYTYYDEEIMHMIRDIKLGQDEDLVADVENCISQLKSGKVSMSQLRIIAMSFYIELSKVGVSYEMEAEDIFGSGDVYHRIRDFYSLETFGEWMLSAGRKIRTHIQTKRVNSTKMLIEKAIMFINENYHEKELSIEKICSYLNVSSAYFSTIFKKDTQKTFVQYLTDLRMEKAIELLKTTEDKTYIIAEKVGYPDPNYFSYVFKKQYGIAPSKYRRNDEQA